MRYQARFGERHRRSRSNHLNHGQIKKTSYEVIFIWLGDEFLNGTFTDVADLDADIAEIEALLAIYEDVSCSK